MPNTARPSAMLRTRLDQFRRNILSDMELRGSTGPRDALRIVVDALEDSGFVHAAAAYLLEGKTLTCLAAPGTPRDLPVSCTDHPAVRALARTLVSDYRQDGCVDFAAAVGGPPAPTGVLHAVLTDDSLDAQLLVRHLFQAASDRMRLLQLSAGKGLAHRGIQRPTGPYDLLERLAHEINNPLAAMLAHLEVLRMDRGDDPVVAGHVDALIPQVDRLAAILKATRTLAEASADAAHPADVGRSLGAVVALVRHQYRAGGVEFQVEIPQDLPSIHGSEAALQQVWLNYFHNAFGAMCAKDPPGGCLRVKAFHNKNLRQIVVEISDDGVGMDVDTLRSLTAPGRPAQMPGIGTREAARIIAELKGRTYFTSEPGRGTAVRVTLPVEEGHRGSPLSGAEP